MTPQWSKMTQHHLVIELHILTKRKPWPDQGRWPCHYPPWINQRLTSKPRLCAHIFRAPAGKHWSQISWYCAGKHLPPTFFQQISVFLMSFGLLFTNLGTDAVDRLMICGDFNLPGTSPDTIDNGLAELLHSASVSQFVKSPTRHDSHHDRSSLLDLIITPSSSKLVTVTSVISSHEISDHDLNNKPTSTQKRYKSPQRTYHYRNIKGINLELFEQSILSFSLFF